MKFYQLIKHVTEKLFPNLFLKISKLIIPLNQQSKVFYSWFLLPAKMRAIKVN